jgi:hypothetical protein
MRYRWLPSPPGYAVSYDGYVIMVPFLAGSPFLLAVAGARKLDGVFKPFSSQRNRIYDFVI